MQPFNVLYIGDVPKIIRDELNTKLPEGFKLDFLSEKSTEEERDDSIEKAHFIMGFPRGFTPEQMMMARNLKMVQLLSAGYDYFDIDLASKMGIHVANNGGANSVAVAEHVIMMILALYKKLYKYQKALRRGVWYRDDNHPVELYELANKVVGIIGFGNIGKSLAKRLKGFQVEINYYDIIRYKEHEKKLGVNYLEFEDILRSSDIISIHVPLLESTKNMISTKELNMMKKNAIIINTARGGIVDEKALYEALKSKRIAGVGLDVFSRENDLQKGAYISPVLKLENVVLTPHYAGHTYDTWFRRIKNGYENIVAFIKGNPRWVVNE